MRPVEYTEHGSYAYARRNNCSCGPCKAATYTYRKGHRTDITRGFQRRVPVEPSREHLQRLLDLGGDFQKILAASGGMLVRSQLRNIIKGTNHITGKPQTTVSWRTENLILALSPERVLQGDEYSQLPATGARRRIQALEAIGFSKADIAKEWGVSTSRVYLVFQYEQIQAGTLSRIVEVYDKMSVLKGTNELVRWRAIRGGWPPPMAWDDETIDDPDVKPDFKMVACAVEDCTRGVKARGLCYGHDRLLPRDIESRRFRTAVMRLKPLGANSKQAELLADVRELRDQGLQLPEVAAKLGRSEKYIDRIWYAA